MEPPHAAKEAAAATAAGAGGGGEGGGASPGTDLEGPMLRLGLDGGGEEGRTGELGAGRRRTRGCRSGLARADCGYYLPHGRLRLQGALPLQPPRDRGGTDLVEVPRMEQHKTFQNDRVNLYHEGEKECSYYMKTGQCKFGSTCKFHHPEFGGIPVTPGIYPPLQSASVPSPHAYAPNWQMGRSPAVPGSYIPGSYTPMMLSSGMVPLQGWSPYPASVNPVASGGAQQTVQAGPLYGIGHHGSSTAIAYGGAYLPYSSSTGQSSNNHQEHGFPERPGQPECQYFMRTGDCKFGTMCKYNHPRDWSTPKSNYMFSHLCLPLRPDSLTFSCKIICLIKFLTQSYYVIYNVQGAQPCAYYAQNGYCRYGVACKYDHPMGTLGYSSSALPLSDMPIAPYPIGFSVATLAPSSSSPEYISTKDPSINQVASPVAAPEHVGAILPKGVFPSDTIMRTQTSTSVGSSSPGGGR
ncbi:unnamed protein product [Miscanthus lutarioriparius]|uniref:C3H1-type domain-containing protein n=1 Tax=Miscanthus lutarioriparius TaxID=422564 RepID=A0A811SJH0_9POAL|nr:unnamed protein product [Miscanthus lutarioriparius]